MAESISLANNIPVTTPTRKTVVELSSSEED